MRTSYLDYAMSVIVSRALPDVRDGFKPVHRRILYAMGEMGLSATSHTANARRSSARCWASTTRTATSPCTTRWSVMAQDFSMRYPLVDGQGNFGSVDGDAPAAMRYTEARLTAIAGETARRHRQGHGRLRRQLRRHPEAAVGAAGRSSRTCSSTVNRASPSGWPPTSRLTTWARSWTRRSPSSTIPELTSDDLCKYVQGPDFPTGGDDLPVREAAEHADRRMGDRRRHPADVRPRPWPGRDARPGRLRGGPRRPDRDHRHRAAVPGEQGIAPREDRGPGQGQAGRRDRRPA